MKTIQYNK